jgi:predicted nucleotidyltransferase
MATLEDSLRRVLDVGPPLRLAVLFGSQARGRAHADSDVDVAVLRWEIARHGILLVASPPAEWLRFRAAAASEHAEIRESLERAAELFRRRILRPA